MKKNQESTGFDRVNLWEFKLPRYIEIPGVGLYLKQVVKLIGDAVSPLGISVSDTMLSNYVKLHIVAGPVKKMYYKEQIAALMFVVLAKTVLSLDNIQVLLKMQAEGYEPEVAYDYFCNEFENVMAFVCGKKSTMDVIGQKDNEEKKLLRNVIVTIAHKFYLDDCFAKLQPADEAAGE